MVKLLKYEFRKARTLLLILLGVTALLEIFFLYALAEGEGPRLGAATGLLVLSTFAVAAFVFVRGITTYSSELKDRSAYLIFMTPNSGLKIMASKFLFTFLTGLLFAGVYLALAVTDIVLLLEDMDAVTEFLDTLAQALTLVGMGVHYDQMALAGLAFAVYFFLSVLSVVALAYLAITLSHTLFRDKKWRWLASVALFWGLWRLVSEVNGLFPTVYDELTYLDTPFAQSESAPTAGLTVWDMLRYQLPQAALSLGVILLSLFGCAWMLDKKVSL